MTITRDIKISGVSHQPLTVTVDGHPARLAILDDTGQIVAEGDQVAAECARIAQAVQTNFWAARGWVREIAVIAAGTPE